MVESHGEGKQEKENKHFFLSNPNQIHRLLLAKAETSCYKLPCI